MGDLHEAGVDVELLVEGDMHPLEPTVELTAYRVVQESLTNVLDTPAHDGPASGSRTV